VNFFPCLCVEGDVQEQGTLEESNRRYRVMISSRQTQTKSTMGPMVSTSWCVRHLEAAKRLDCAYLAIPVTTSSQFANPEVGT